MRKLVVSMNMTLDGFMAGLHGELDWHIPYWNEEMARTAAEQLGRADTILLGRVTYQMMASYWPLQQTAAYSPREDADYAAMMNRYEKVVASKTMLRAANWQNSRLAKRNIAKEISELKQQVGKEIIIYGSGKLVTALTKLNLIDEYRLWIHPVAIKKGRPLFKGLQNLKICNKTEFSSGVVLMCYTVIISRPCTG
ncbi:dihydrofolate reductase [Inquilinus sp. KBS0705]|nr:dihydrofolate reductase [Inquilinus sp. KBS0705]